MESCKTGRWQWVKNDKGPKNPSPSTICGNVAGVGSAIILGTQRIIRKAAHKPIKKVMLSSKHLVLHLMETPSPWKAVLLQGSLRFLDRKPNGEVIQPSNHITLCSQARHKAAMLLDGARFGVPCPSC